MRILFCFLIGLIAAMASFGWRALSSGRAHDFAVATELARKSTIVAFLIALVSTTALFGWPWRPTQSSVAEEVSRTAMETVEEVVEVPYWFFFKEKQIVKREVPKTVIDVVQHPTTVYVFSIWMLIPMAVIGAGAALLQFKVLRFVWWWRG